MNENNLTWEEHRLSKKERVALNGQKPFVVWLTGLSGSGKSSLADLLELNLFKWAIGPICWMVIMFAMA